MKGLALLLFLTFIAFGIQAQGVGIGTTNPNVSAELDIQSSDGGILIPRMSRANRDNIPTPATGLMIYQTNFDPGFYYNRGNFVNPDWVKVGDYPPFAGGQQSYPSAGTYTFIVPSGVHRINYEMAAGGGGIGGNYTTGPTYRGGGGGGGGGFLWGYLEVSPGDTLTIIVGNRGTNGNNGAPGTDGADGGASSISLGSMELAKVSGGKGGKAASAAAAGNGGSGGSPVVWQTSQSKGIRSLANSLSGLPGRSSTASGSINYLTGQAGKVVSMGKFNWEFHALKFQLVGGGATELYDTFLPYYGTGGGPSPNNNARWGYVAMYW